MFRRLSDGTPLSGILGYERLVPRASWWRSHFVLFRASRDASLPTSDFTRIYRRLLAADSVKKWTAIPTLTSDLSVCFGYNARRLSLADESRAY